MQCSGSAKPVKAVWYDVTRTVKVKIDFVNVINDLFQNRSSHLGMQMAVEFSPTWLI